MLKAYWGSKDCPMFKASEFSYSLIENGRTGQTAHDFLIYMRAAETTLTFRKCATIKPLEFSWALLSAYWHSETASRISLQYFHTHCPRHMNATNFGGTTNHHYRHHGQSQYKFCDLQKLVRIFRASFRAIWRQKQWPLWLFGDLINPRHLSLI